MSKTDLCNCICIYTCGRGVDHAPGLLRAFLNQIWTLLKGTMPQDAINVLLRQYKQIISHHALDMRSPVPEAVLEKAEISGAEKWG